MYTFLFFNFVIRKLIYSRVFILSLCYLLDIVIYKMLYNFKLLNKGNVFWRAKAARRGEGKYTNITIV